MLKYYMGRFRQFVERYGGAESMIMYHGTSSKNYQSIMSQGLIPNPVRRNWDDDPDSNFNNPSRASLAGVYVSGNLMTAISASTNKQYKQDDALLIVLEIQPRSLATDEDNINFTSATLRFPNSGSQMNEYLLSQIYFAWKTNTNMEYVEEMKQQFVKDSIHGLGLKLNTEMHPGLIQRLTQLLEEGFFIVLERQAAYLEDYYWQKGVSYYKGVENLQKPDKAQVESRYAQWTNSVTKTMKWLSQPNRLESDWNVAGRVLESIGFSGKNKILAVIFNPRDYKLPPRVLYPPSKEVPPKFIEDWEKSVGEWKPE